MTKNTMSTKLPRKITEKMQIVGEQIKLESTSSTARWRCGDIKGADYVVLFR